MSTVAMLYIIALIVGGGLLLLSVLFGSHGGTDVHADLSGGMGMDAHAGGDLHHGVDTEHHGGHGLSLSSWFSMQFAVYFLVTFGLLGTTLTYVARVRSGVVLACATIGALVVGQLVHQALRALKRSGVGSDLTPDDYLNKAARVTIALEASRRGEVALPSRNGERFLAAVARRGDDRFKVGDRVVVVGLSNGVAEVVSKEEYEFVNEPKSGENA